jgi:hypothetical protein
MVALCHGDVVQHVDIYGGLVPWGCGCLHDGDGDGDDTVKLLMTMMMYILVVARAYELLMASVVGVD